MTTAMAAIFFLLWVIWAIQAQGVGGFLKHLFAPKGETTGILKVLMAVVFFIVGWLVGGVVLFFPILFSVRLFWDIYAGGSIFEAVFTMKPLLSPVFSISFYFFESIL